MHQRLIEVTRDLEAAHRDLLGGYDPVRLYNLRVAIRRVRSILKLIDSHRSRGLRKAWGGLAAVTGSARDWDVFLDSAESLLGPERAAEFERINGDRILASHQAVTEMLESAPWQRHMEDWKQFLESADDTPPEPEAARAALALAIERAQGRHRSAMVKNNDRRWHKYRIAVKEVRYVAEANTSLPGMAGIAESCKPLQTLLGDWHDTVVQLNLLYELPPAAVHDELTTLIEERQAGLLARIRNSRPPDQPVW